jgi:hypothetical protein
MGCGSTGQMSQPWDAGRVECINDVLADLMALREGENKLYWFASEKQPGLTAETVLGAFVDLAVFTARLENTMAEVVDARTGVAEQVLGGDFGARVSRELLAYEPDDVILIYNMGEWYQNGQTYKLFEVYVNRKYDIRVQLTEQFGRPADSVEWGVYFIDKRSYTDGAQDKILVLSILFEYPDPKVFPELDLQRPIVSFFSYRKLADEAETILDAEGWLYQVGNPNPIRHRDPGPPE